MGGNALGVAAWAIAQNPKLPIRSRLEQPYPSGQAAQTAAITMTFTLDDLQGFVIFLASLAFSHLLPHHHKASPVLRVRVLLTHLEHRLAQGRRRG